MSAISGRRVPTLFRGEASESPTVADANPDAGTIFDELPLNPWEPRDLSSDREKISTCTKLVKEAATLFPEGIPWKTWKKIADESQLTIYKCKAIARRLKISTKSLSWTSKEKNTLKNEYQLAVLHSYGQGVSVELWKKIATKVGRSVHACKTYMYAAETTRMNVGHSVSGCQTSIAHLKSSVQGSDADVDSSLSPSLYGLDRVNECRLYHPPKHTEDHLGSARFVSIEDLLSMQ